MDIFELDNFVCFSIEQFDQIIFMFRDDLYKL